MTSAIVYKKFVNTLICSFVYYYTFSAKFVLDFFFIVPRLLFMITFSCVPLMFPIFPFV